MRRTVILLSMMSASLAAQPASIEGTVVDQTSGKPLERVHVRLTAAEAYGAMSDASGHFSMARVSPGKYQLLAERTGYLQAADNTTLTIKAGQQLTDLTVKMARASTLAGRVVDPYGDPVADMVVQAALVPPAKLSPSLIPLGGYSTTDERGEFHLLVGPGKYHLHTGDWRSGRIGPAEVRTDGTAEMTYAPTYYPNAASQERAAVVEAIAGRDLEGLEIRLTTVSQHLLTVSGTVTGLPEGAYGMVVLYRTEDQTAPTRVGIGSESKFTVSGLTPGVYEVAAISNFGTRKSLVARTKIHLDASDLTNLELSLNEPGELGGTLETFGGSATDAQGKRMVRLQTAGESWFLGEHNASAAVGADGSFRMMNVWPGTFRVAVDPFPENAYLQSVELDGAVAADGAIELYGDHLPLLKITMGLDGATISGKVVDQDGGPSQGARVYLMADSKEIGATSSSEDGTYALKGIRPGKYRLFTLHSGENFAAKSDGAEEIELRPGDRITKDFTDGKKQ